MQRSISILWMVVIILLLLNLALLYGLNLVRLNTIQALSEVEETLADLGHEVIVYDIEVKQAVPIQADVPLNQRLEIPLNTVIPIDQVLTVPFQVGTDEVELELPVKADFPINMVVPIDFNEIIKVDTTVALDTTIPVEIDIAKTPLVDYLDRARQNVSQLKSHLTLLGEAELTTEEVALAAAADTTRSNSPDQTQLPVTTDKELIPTTTPTPEPTLSKRDPLAADSSSRLTEPQVQPDRAGPQPIDLGLCEHPYWPLRLGTAWTYNSSHTSYTQQVIDVLDNQVALTTAYEGQPIQLGLTCSQEGLAAGYLGDMRRITEFGQLKFSSLRGLFLPRLEVMEDIGASWAQEFDMAGLVEGRQGHKPVTGHINHGRAVALYTPTGFETLQTPLGPREALRIEQKLDLELELDFDLGHRTIPATEMVNLTNVYWFVKGIGLVKMHWQGGSIQQQYALGDTAANKQFSIPALPEEYLVFVCVLSAQASAECMGLTGISHSDLTVPPEAELEIPGFVFPEDIIKDDQVTPEDSIDSQEQFERPADDYELPEDQPELDDDDRAALFAYAEVVADVGDKISGAGESFGEAAIAYRNRELTLAEFHDKFSSFKSKARGLIREIDGLSPPPAAAATHQKLTGGLAKCDDAIDLMDAWFDTQDGGTKAAAALLVAGCLDQVNEAASELEALVNQP